MRRRAFLACLAILGLVAPIDGERFARRAHAVTPGQPRVRFRPGEAAYVCPNPECGRGTIARLPAKCACGADTVPAVVLAVDEQTALVRLEGKVLRYLTAGRYVCGCGARCPCNLVSQEPGWCACGNPLVPAESLAGSSAQPDPKHGASHDDGRDMK